MKKYTLFLSAVLIALLIAGCAKLLQYLSAEDSACIDRVTAHLVKSVPAEDHDAFAAQCQNLLQHADPNLAQLAQILLSSLS